MDARKSQYSGKVIHVRNWLIRICICGVFASNLANKCSAVDDPQSDSRLTELMEESAKKESNMSAVAFGVLCTSRWRVEQNNRIANFVRTKISIIESDVLNSGIRQLASSNRLIAKDLLPEIVSRLTLRATPENLDLIITLRELGEQNSIATRKLEEIVDTNHIVLSSQAAAALLKMNGSNNVASDYLINQLQSSVAERIWRAAFALGVSGSKGVEPLPILREHLSNRDVCVRTLCAAAILNGDFSKTDVELAQSTLAGVLCLSDRVCPTEFISPSDVGTTHRLIALNTLSNSDRELSIYWGPLLVMILSDDSSPSATMLRIRSLQLISQQKTIPLYIRNALTVLASNPELIGLKEVDATSVSLIGKMLEKK